MTTLLIGTGIFLARICDVSIGTLRTLLLVQGRILLAFILGFVEVIIWIYVVSTVIIKLQEALLLGIFYAPGFATGNAVGILLERKLALGYLVIRIFTREAGAAIAAALRDDGFRVTSFTGEGMRGPVTELYIVCQHKEQKRIASIAAQKDPDALCITEYAREIYRMLHVLQRPVTGWRSVFKKK